MAFAKFTSQDMDNDQLSSESFSLVCLKYVIFANAHFCKSGDMEETTRLQKYNNTFTRDDEDKNNY